MMNETKINRFNAFFDEKIAACRAEAEALALDDRQDEAAFAKIRLNVYDIFRTVLAAGKGSSEFFRSRLDEIPRNWSSSLALARQHGDDRKAHIEQLKLDTASEIRRAFASIQEEAK